MLSITVNIALWYLAIGAAIWVFLASSGIAAETRLRCLVRGIEVTSWAVVLASVVVIVGWPVWVVRRAGR